MALPLNMRPRVSKRDQKVHLSYDLPHRIHCSKLYPITAPNGSTVIIYGHDRGLRILWRGGRPLKHQSASQSASQQQPNGTAASGEVITIDDSDNEEPSHKDDQELDAFEVEEEEMDPDEPYLRIVQDLSIDLDCEVLKLAMPPVPTQNMAMQSPAMLKTGIVVSTVCSDGSIKLITVPLTPPKDVAKAQQEINRRGHLTIRDAGCAHDVSVTWTEANDSRSRSKSGSRSRSRARDVKWQLLVAAVSLDVSKGLRIWRISLLHDITSRSRTLLLRSLPLPCPSIKVSFNASIHPSPRHTQVLIVDAKGSARVYDPYGIPSSRSLPHDSPGVAQPHDGPGKWLMTYQTSYQMPKDGTSPALAQHKKILDAKWVCGGRCILALLEDGEWGMWDLEGPTPSVQARGANPADFALRGFIPSAASVNSAEPTKQKKGMSKLAPMTPNTRRTRQDALFSGPPSVPGKVAEGGISTTANSARSGQADESVVIWYNGEIYAILSMVSFWQRSTNASSNSTGSLYSPGLSRVESSRLFHEQITSIDQFPSKSTSTGLGQMNTQRDLLASAEHRFVILASTRSQAPPKSLFEQINGDRPTSRDQKMLDAGNLDLGGVDRVLNGMASAGDGVARGRRVGFAS